MSKKIIIGIAAVIAMVLIVAVVAALSAPSYPNKDIPRPARGNPNAAIVVQEFSDFQCPACIATSPLASQLVETYGEHIRFEYRHLPLRQIHPRAQRAAEASECANDFGKFWEYHDVLFESNYRRLSASQDPALSDADLAGYATQVGIDRAEFEACLFSGAKRGAVDADLAAAQRSGYNSTPTFVVSGARITGDTLSVVMQNVENEIKQKILEGAT